MGVAEAHGRVAEPAERRLQREDGRLRLVLHLGVGRVAGARGVAAEEIVGEADSHGSGRPSSTRANPQKTGSGTRRTPKRARDAVAHAPRDAHDVRRARALAGDDRQRVARGDARRPVRVAAREAGPLDEPRGGELHPRAARLGPARHGRVARRAAAMRSASAAGTTGFTKNDPQLRRFGSPGSSTIDFARRIASTLSRTSASVGVSMPARGEVPLDARRSGRPAARPGARR